MQVAGTNRLTEADLRDRLSRVRLLVLDVDGVLTDGGLYYTDSGEELKKFNVKDGQGLQLIRQAGLEVAIISASASTATLHRAKKLGISHVYIGVSPKLPVLQELCRKLAITLDQVAYAGDDVKDLPVMEVVGCPMTVADAMPANQTAAIYVTQRGGGQAAVREICELLLAAVKPL
ncbi:HAD-IIIA family hydrolase [Sphaerothrix gracilis]|uniref:KdsC family phosphatase n=1 Tax=Sphaerothrix gracilis TaxID=3151835 RepID=UPI0031FBBDD4